VESNGSPRMTKIYIASDVLGFFAIDERGVLVDKELYERKAQYVRRLYFLPVPDLDASATPISTGNMNLAAI
jgi:hypothetical protein